MKKYIGVWLLICGIFLVSGCAKAVPEEDMISIDKKGTILRTVVEDFDKDYYDAEELNAMIEEDAASYNSKFGQEHLTVEKFEVKDGIAVLQTRFDEAKYYADYSGTTFYAGTVLEALEEGYDLFGECMGTDGSLTDLGSMEEAVTMHVVLLEEAVRVEVPGNIVCVSRAGNVMINEKKEATVLQAEEAFIVYK